MSKRKSKLAKVMFDHSGIRTAGDPILRKRAALVEDSTDVTTLYDNMLKILREIGGQGLAAPQIGESLQVAVIETRPNNLNPLNETSPPLCMINPRILSCKGMELAYEACFSFPGFSALVPSPTEIEVEYVDIERETHTETFIGYMARVVRHELDHLSGILYADSMVSQTLTTLENRDKYRLL